MDWSNSLKRAALAAVAAFALLAPGGASAATVVNGDFETGNLTGWQQFNQFGANEWFTYDKEEAEAESFFPPPFGNFAAVDTQGNPDLGILYQDIALEPAYTHHLAMTLYYISNAPITVPDPPTLDITGEDNQQVRVDVIKPTAPIASVNPADILVTLFANKNGDSVSLTPTLLTADLTPFGGQTVRLRIANAVNRNIFNTGLDGVSITSTPPPPPPPPVNDIARGKLTLNKKKGTGKLTINVPGPGSLKSVDARKAKKRVKGKVLNPAAAGVVKVPLLPTKAGQKALGAKGRLKVKLKVTFTPAGGVPNTETFTVTLKKNLPKD